METIINGKKYDTDMDKENINFSFLAGRVFDDGLSDNSSNFSRQEDLFKKDNGEYYLYKHTETEQIIPFTEERAKEWGENNLDCELYEAIFGGVKE